MTTPSVDSICSEALLDYGVHVDIEPSHLKMGVRVQEAAEQSARILAAKNGPEGCGALLAEIAKMVDAKIRRYTYYRCTMRGRSGCRQPSIELSRLEGQMREYLSAIDVNPAALVKAIDHLKKTRSVKQKAPGSVRVTRANTKKEIERKLSVLLDLKLNDQVSESEYKSKRSELVQERMTRDEVGRTGNSEQALRRNLPERMLSFASSLCERFTEADCHGKGEILNTFGSNFILDEGKLSVELYKPFRMLRKFPSGPRSEGPSFEPSKTPIVEGRKGHSDPSSLLLCRQSPRLENIMTLVSCLRFLRYYFMPYLQPPLVDGAGPLPLRLMWTGKTLKTEQVLETIWIIYDEFCYQTNGVAIEDVKECFARVLVP